MDWYVELEGEEWDYWDLGLEFGKSSCEEEVLGEGKLMRLIFGIRWRVGKVKFLDIIGLDLWKWGYLSAPPALISASQTPPLAKSPLPLQTKKSQSTTNQILRCKMSFNMTRSAN